MEKNTNKKKIETSNFRVENNIICFENTILQISNISQITIEPARPMKFNYWSVVAVIVGVLCLCAKGVDAIQTVGLIATLGGAVYILTAVILISDEKSKNFLFIYLNSGIFYSFLCEDEIFLAEVMMVLEYCINNHSIQDTIIDFIGCKLYNSPIISGKENGIYYG